MTKALAYCIVEGGWKSIFSFNMEFKLDNRECFGMDGMTIQQRSEARLVRRRYVSLTGALLWLFVTSTGIAQIPAAKESAVERLAKAEAMFQARCKTAGEKIYKTVENVEGVFLMKVRPRDVNHGDQFALTDPYGDDLGGNAYIRMFLRGSYEVTHIGTPIKGAPPVPDGFLYVDAIDPEDRKRYRYTGRIDEPWKYDASYSKTYKRFVHDKVPATGVGPRYGVTYDDISTREEREYWIAGSSLKVIDLETNEVVAERIGYMMDRGQGNRSGGRSPWLYAADNACPSFQRNPLRPPGHGAEGQRRQAQYFVEKVLRPKPEK